MKVDDLTAREKEVLSLYAQGYSEKEIADLLCITIKTVDSHKHQSRIKLGFENYGRGLLRKAVMDWYIEREVNLRLSAIMSAAHSGE